MLKDVFIVEGVRTPFSPFDGPLRDIPSIELGAGVIKEIIKRSDLKGDQIDEIFYGMTQMAEAALYPGSRKERPPAVDECANLWLGCRSTGSARRMGCPKSNEISGGEKRREVQDGRGTGRR
jgi:hypothetical protein